MAKKGERGNGEGSIYQRPDGTWRAQYTVHTSNGRKRKTLYGRTLQEVDKKLTRAKTDREGGLTLDAGLAPRTVRYVHTTLNKALKDALADSLIPRNVASTVKPPKLTMKEIRPLSPEQASAFLTAARGDRFEALYVVAITAGLREGELLGLKWEDVDLESGTLSVRRTLSEARSGRFFEPPKNGKGRSIRLTACTLDALTRHKATQNEERLRLGTLWEDNDLVFPSGKGTPMNAKNLTARSFKPLLKSAGLPNIRLHELRHTCATLLLSRGVHPKLVQELLGHATISITLDTYSHVLPGMGDQTVTAMESVLP